MSNKVVSLLPPLFELTRWRVREFMREPEAIFWVFAFPILLALALGIAFQSRAPQAIRIAVEGGQGAAELASVLDEDEGLEVRVLAPDEAQNALRTGRVPLVVVPGAPVAFRYDSTREESHLARLLTSDVLQRASGREDVREIRELRVTEPGARYIDFLIPGLIGMNIMGTGLWGVGFAIVRTRSRKLLKRFLASPMRRSHFLLAHMLARLVFLAFEVTAVMLFGHFVFGVPVEGSIFAITVVVVVGAMSFSGLGILVASRPETIEGVSGLMNLVMVPMWIMSGVFFSWSHFPESVQPLIQILPLTALNDALRAVMLDGAPLVATASMLLIMTVWAVGCFGVSLKIFRWS
jgi:ABC-type multidrug transport system permease subunit